MAKNKKPRKAYRPRAVVFDTMGQIKWGIALVGNRALSTLVFTHQSLAALVQGRASVQDWNAVGDAINVTKALDLQCYGAEHADTIERAMMAHALCGARKLRHERFGYTGEQLDAINRAMELHEAMLSAATNSELERALDLVVRMRATDPVDPHQLLTA